METKSLDNVDPPMEIDLGSDDYVIAGQKCVMDVSLENPQ